MSLHPDQRFIEGLINNNNVVVKEIYTRFAGTIARHITENSGTRADAADIFQESLLDIYHQGKHKGLKLTCPFEPFLLLICKRKWLNELKKKGRQPVTKLESDVSEWGIATLQQAGQVEEEASRLQLVMQHFDRLGDRCKEIIKATLSGTAQEKVAARLGVSYGYLRKKKSECLATLLNYVKNAQQQ